MKHIKRKEIEELPQRERANLINSLSGYKSANLIGTVSDLGITNLAVFSSVVHIGSDPPLLGFITRPLKGQRHTYQNIQENGFYSINHVHETFVKNAHWTSAKFEQNESEFEKCGLTEEFIDGFIAPFVAQSKIKIGLKLVEEIPINLNKTIFMIGEIQYIILPEKALQINGNVDLNTVNDICISGQDTYHRVEKIVTLPYAKTSNVPEFDL